MHSTFIWVIHSCIMNEQMSIPSRTLKHLDQNNGCVKLFDQKSSSAAIVPTEDVGVPRAYTNPFPVNFDTARQEHEAFRIIVRVKGAVQIPSFQTSLYRDSKHGLRFTAAFRHQAITT